MNIHSIHQFKILDQRELNRELYRTEHPGIVPPSNEDEFSKGYPVLIPVIAIVYLIVILLTIF